MKLFTRVPLLALLVASLQFSIGLGAETGGSDFITWCERAKTEESIRPIVYLLLWEAGVSYWWQTDCVNAAQQVANLEKIELHSAHLSDIRPLAALKQLKHLALANNDISDLSALAELPTLESLDLQNNRVSSLEPLLGLTKLKVLYVYGNPLSEDALSQFANLENRETATARNFPWSTFARELSVNLGFNLLLAGALGK